jgi:hypothetical protein
MHRLCIPVLTLVLGAPALAAAQTAPEAGASASASASVKVAVSDQDALDDDILAVIDLPLAAADARDAGVEETEIKEALDVTRDAGLSAGDASVAVAEEAELTRTRGVKRGFGHWVRMQVAAGLRGKQLAAKIKARKDEIKDLDEKQAAELQVKIDALREQHKAWKAKRVERRKELIAKGKKPAILHKERHDKLAAKVDTAQGNVAGAQDRVDGRQDDVARRIQELDAKIAAASDADKADLEAEKKRLEKTADRLEKREDRLDKAEDALEKREDRLDKKEGKRLDTKGDLKADVRPGKGDPPAGGKGPRDKIKAGGAAAAQ